MHVFPLEFDSFYTNKGNCSVHASKIYLKALINRKIYLAFIVLICSYTLQKSAKERCLV
jgi:hypothetical protein